MCIRDRGEAELYEDLAHLELDGLTANDVSWTSYFDQLQRDLDTMGFFDWGVN